MDARGDWLGALERPRLIGERLNAAGNPRLASRLAAGDWAAVEEAARAQVDAGADALDVNGALTGADERATLLEMLARARAACDLPLAVDTKDPALFLEAQRVLGGRLILNSIPATQEAITRWLPRLAALELPIVGLALDESGVPASAAARFACAARFVEAGRALGVRDSHLVVDCLALPGGADPLDANAATLEAIRLVKARLGVPVLLGISNVSYDLPRPAPGADHAPFVVARRAAHAALLAGALDAGLDIAIADPLDPGIGPPLRQAARAASDRRARSIHPHSGKEISGCPS